LLEANETKTVGKTIAPKVIRAMVGILALLFLLSSIMNLGYKIPLGFATLSFSPPSYSVATFEAVIGSFLLISAILSNLYVYSGTLLLAAIGIIEGLLSSNVQGLARYIHETMVPFEIVGWAFLIFEARSSYKVKKKDSYSTNERNHKIITVLQFFVSGLVTLGGVAFATGGTYPIGTLLGSIHLAIGLIGLYAGYLFLKRKAWSTKFLIVINGLTIAYSGFAESLAEIYAYLPRGINDALIGTVIAIAVSAVIIYVISSNRKSEASNVSKTSFSIKEKD
jgi:hypothetical protein